ncbi:MAG: hypothetical protein K2O14_08750 [Oscillospiraceae bacterium]|nr:hypothetical protein [Oscillospiraceae bacterium]
MKNFRNSGSQGLENTLVEPNPTELRTDENEKTENLFGRAFMKKVFGRTKDYTCPQSHCYSRRTVTVDGMNYQVINIAPTSLDFIPKKAKELFAYIINGSEK